MKNRFRKMLSLCCAFVMLMSVLPVSAEAPTPATPTDLGPASESAAPAAPEAQEEELLPEEQTDPAVPAAPLTTADAVFDVPEELRQNTWSVTGALTKEEPVFLVRVDAARSLKTMLFLTADQPVKVTVSPEGSSAESRFPDMEADQADTWKYGIEGYMLKAGHYMIRVESEAEKEEDIHTAFTLEMMTASAWKTLQEEQAEEKAEVVTVPEENDAEETSAAPETAAAPEADAEPAPEADAEPAAEAPDAPAAEEESPAHVLPKDIILEEEDFSARPLSKEETGDLVARYLPQPKMTFRAMKAKAAAPAGDQQHTGYAAFDISLTNSEKSDFGSYIVPVRLDSAIDLTGVRGDADPRAVYEVKSTSYELYHIHPDETGAMTAETIPVTTEETKDGYLTGFRFETDGFSTYILKYTVDFHYGGIDYSIPGNSQILLSDLIERMQIKNGDALLNVNDVASVTFSDAHLVQVEEVSGLILYNGAESTDAGEKNFLLSSLAPFTSEEKLTILLTNGSPLLLDVTDAQYIHYHLAGRDTVSMKEILGDSDSDHLSFYYPTPASITINGRSLSNLSSLDYDTQNYIWVFDEALNDWAYCIIFYQDYICQIDRTGEISLSELLAPAGVQISSGTVLVATDLSCEGIYQNSNSTGLSVYKIPSDDQICAIYELYDVNQSRYLNWGIALRGPSAQEDIDEGSNEIFTYELDEENRTFTILGLSDNYSENGNVVIPSAMTVDETEYAFAGFAQDAFKGDARLITVSVPDGIGRIPAGAFEDCENLSALNLGLNGDNQGKDLLIETNALAGSQVTSAVKVKQTVESEAGAITLAASDGGTLLGIRLIINNRDENPEIKATADAYYANAPASYAIHYYDLSLVTLTGETVQAPADVSLSMNADWPSSVAVPAPNAAVFHKTEASVEQIAGASVTLDGNVIVSADFHADHFSPFGVGFEYDDRYHDDMFWYDLIRSDTGKVTEAVITGIYDEYTGNTLEFSNTTRDANRYPVTQVQKEAFKGNTFIETIVGDASLSAFTFNENAFEGMSALKQVSFPGSRHYSSRIIFKANAFNNCTALKDLIYMDWNVTVESDAFSGCSGLNTVIFAGKGNTDIKKDAFRNAENIRYLRIDNPCDLADGAMAVKDGLVFVQNNDAPLSYNPAKKFGQFKTYVYAENPWYMGRGLSDANVASTLYIAKPATVSHDLVDTIVNAHENLRFVYLDCAKDAFPYADELEAAKPAAVILYRENEETSGFYLDGVNGDDETADGSLEHPFKTFGKLAECWPALFVDENPVPAEKTHDITASVQDAYNMLAVSDKTPGTFITRITPEKNAYILNTVTVSSTETWDYEGEDELVLTRAPGFEGIMVRNQGNLTLKHVVLDGGSDHGLSASSPIINSSGKLTITEGAVIRNNYRTSFAYPDKAGGIYASGSVTMDGGEISGNTGIYGGGIQICGSGSVFSMSGGTIRNNQTLASNESYGGGVNVGSGAEMYLSGGTIEGNKVLGTGSAVGGAGGGISLGANVSGMCQNARLVMTGGTISGNESAQSGGGVFIQTNCTANITAGHITNNTCHGGDYGGGGIYANGVRDDTQDGRLYLNNVLIANNSANETGGGYAGCCTSTAYIYMGNGAALYGNSAGDGSDFHVGTEYHVTPWGMQSGTPSAFVSQYMFNGTEYHWKNIATGKEMTAAELARISTDLSMRAAPDGTQPTSASVIITGNHSDTKGGGVGSNGFVSIGDAPGPNDVKWTPAADKILYGRDMKEGETFTFTVYEEKASQGLSFWWTRYQDTQVGTGTVTGGKDGEKATISFTEIDLGEKSAADLGEMHTFLIREDSQDDGLIHPDYYLAFNVVIGEKLDDEVGKLIYCAEVKSIERGRIVDDEYEFDNTFNGTVSERASAEENFGRIRMKTDGATFVNTEADTVVKVVKKWTDAEGNEIDAPEGAKVTLQLYADGKTTVRKQGYTDPIQLEPITLDGEWDYDGEGNAWMAVWDYPSLPVYRLDKNGQMYRTSESGDDYDRIVYTVKEIENNMGLTFAPASPDVGLEYKYDEYHIAGRLDDNGYEKRFMFTGEIANGQGSLEISKTVKVSRDGETVTADSDDIRSKDYYVQVSTMIGDDTHYVSLNDEGRPVLTTEQPSGDNRLKVSAASPLLLSPLPGGTYTVEEIGTEDELSIGGMSLIAAESQTLRTVVVTPASGEEKAPARAELVNTYANGRYCVAVTKRWDDDDNRDGVRPGELFVELYRGGVLQTVGKDASGNDMTYLTLNEANHWTAMVRGVELYDPEDGTYHEYTWEEFVFGPDGTSRIYPETKAESGVKEITFTTGGRSGAYTSTNDGVDEIRDNELGTITFITRLTNHYEPERVNVKATKAWADEDGFTGLRKDISLRLEGFYIYTDDEGSDATCYITDSGLYQPVQEIRALNSDGTTNGDLTAEWKNLPKYADGHEITYKVTEVDVPEGYTVSYASGTGDAAKTDGTVADGELVVTNTLNKGSILISKSMFVNDDRIEDREGAKDTVKAVFDEQKDRAFYVTVSTKIGNDTWYVTRDSGLLKKDLSADDRTVWSVTLASPLTISNLPEGEYTVTEVADENGTELNSANGRIGSMTFVPMLSRTADTAQVTAGETAPASLVNKYTAGKYCIAVTKQWLVNEKAYADDTLAVTVALQRTITPENADSYKTVQRGKADGEGTEDYTLVLNKANNWSAMALGQEQMDANGNRYSYRWVEVEDTIPAGWTQGETTVPQQMTLDGTVLIFLTRLTNKMDLTSVTVEKQWEDGEDQDGIRPASVTVELLADGTPVDQIELNRVNSWKYTFDKLATRKNGAGITYTVREINVPAGYVASVEKAKDADGREIAGSYVVTNTHEPGLINIPVQKVWDDAGDRDGKRPDSVKILLLADGGKIAEAEMRPLDGDSDIWSYTFENLPKYKDGNEIVYTIDEEPVPNYTSAIDGFTVTNRHEPAKQDTSVIKVWNDNGNHDGKRPETLTVTLVKEAGGEKTEEDYILSAGNDWKIELKDLPKYENHGKAVVYSWIEKNVPEGYAAEAPKVEGTQTTITNTHEDKKTQATLVKVWEDGNNRDGLRPGKVKFLLLKDNQQIREVELTSAAADPDHPNTWTYTETGLDKYNAGGDLIAYSWLEETGGLGDYMLSGIVTEKDAEGNAATTITNRYDPDYVTLTAVKIWEDAGNRDGLRPDAVTVTLYKGEGSAKTPVKDYTLKADDGWVMTTEPLLKYEHGVEVKYSLEEKDVPDGYALTETKTAGYTWLFTNTHAPEETAVSVTKRWKDADDQDGIRPESVTVLLLANGKPVDRAEVKGTYTFNNLPKFNGSTEPIAYTVEEINVPEGYYVEQIAGNMTDGYMITNTHVPETTEITIRKIWDDAEDQEGIRPEKVHIRLLADGEQVDEADAADPGWSHTFGNLPKFRNGREIVYTITEDEVEGYVTSIDGYTVTNRHVPAVTEATVKKVWDDDANRDGLRPGALTVKLYANGEFLTSVLLAAENGWSATVGSLPKIKGGRDVAYTWEEAPVDGYASSRSTDGTVTTFTNKYTPDTTKAEVEKLWKDDNNRDGKRPAFVTMALMKNNVKTERTVILSEENHWKGEIDGLPKYENNGDRIVYSFLEESVRDYSISNYEIDGTKTTIENTYTPGQISLTVVKAWEDENDADRLRPESVTVKLLAGGEPAKYADGTDVPEVVLSKANHWTSMVKGLPVMNGGREIAYAWTEAAVNGYNLNAEGIPQGQTVTVDETRVTAIVNTHETKVTSISVRKIWDDEDNRDGIRPDAVTVQLLANGRPADEKLLNAGNEWKHTFTELPVRMNGDEVTYTVREINVPEGYEAPVITGNAAEGFTVTNRHVHQTETTEATVQKIWADSDNEAGLRPETLKMILTIQGSDEAIREVTLDREHGWTATVEGLPAVDEHEEKIIYVWKEAEMPEGYTLTSDTTAGTVTTLVNTWGVTTSAIVRKIWSDGEEVHAGDSVTVKLMKNGTAEAASFELNAENDWTAEAKDLPLTEDGQAVAYSWSEVSVPGYAATATVNGNVTIITNTLIPSAKGEFTASKTWENGSGNAALTLTGRTRNADGTLKVVFSDSRSVSGNGTVRWTETPLFTEEGQPILYSLTEEGVDANGMIGDSIISSITGDETTGYVVVNHAKPEQIEIPGEPITVTNTVTITEETVSAVAVKVWEDNNNAYGARPESLTVTLENTGEAYTLSEENHWTATVSGLPAKDGNGETIQYTWSEPHVSGYASAKAVNGNVTVFTNTYTPEPLPEEPETVTVGVKKVWDDDQNAHRMRPANLTVTLSNGAAYTLNAGNNWSVTVENLPARDADGNVITYTWKEQFVPGYTLTDETTIGSMTVLTNHYRHEPEKPTTTASVIKLWDDENNAYGVRPANIHVTLSNGTTYTLNEANNWSTTVNGLPAEDEAGNAIVYTWTEQNVPGYTLTNTTVAGNTTIFTNRYRPETEEPMEEVPTTSASVVKIWDDDDNVHGRRPTHLRVTLSNGTSYDLNAGNNWSVTVNDLPAVDASGNHIVYTWSEQSVPGYEYVGSTTTGNTTVFTNRYREIVVPPTVPGTKTPGTPMVILEDYETPLGVGVTINHVGDCFE